MEETYAYAIKWNIKYSYPFLDVKLVEFYYSLPAEYKRKDGIGRYVFRQAMTGLLPDRIRNRVDKIATTVPNALYRILKDEKEIKELIAYGRENFKFHYVDYDKMEWLLKQIELLKRGTKIDIGIRFFLNAISVLILQKWQREGKIDIGIKC